MPATRLSEVLLPGSTPRRGPAPGPRVLVAVGRLDGDLRAYLVDTLPLLARAGYRCTVAADDPLPDVRAALDGVAGVDFLEPDGNLRRAVRAGLHCRSFGLVLAHGLSAASQAWLGGLGTSVPLAVLLHEPPGPGPLGDLFGAARRWLLGRLLARTAGVLTVGTESRASLFRAFPNLRRHQDGVHVLPPGIDTRPPHRRPRHANLRDELELNDETTLVGFVGSFDSRGGFPLFIEAVARLVRHGGVPPFHVVASGPAEGALEVRAALASRELTTTVSLRGPADEAAALLDSLDLLVLPSPRSSARLAMAAMALGVPVLAAEGLGLLEVLADTPSRKVPAGDLAALETGLREALARPWLEEAQAFVPVARRRFDHRPAVRILVQRLDRLAGLGTTPMPSARA